MHVIERTLILCCSTKRKECLSVGNCRAGRSENSGSSSDAVAMNIYSNEPMECGNCGGACSDSLRDLLECQTAILEKILRALRRCCGGGDEAQASAYSTGRFNVPANCTISVQAFNPAQTGQNMEAAVYSASGCRPELISAFTMMLDPRSGHSQAFDRIFTTGQELELLVTSGGACFKAAVTDLTGQTLMEFSDGDFTEIPFEG